MQDSKTKVRPWGALRSNLRLKKIKLLIFLRTSLVLEVTSYRLHALWYYVRNVKKLWQKKIEGMGKNEVH